MLRLISRLVLVGISSLIVLVAAPTAAYAQEPASSAVQTAEEIKMPPGDTQEVRTGAGAVIGGVLGALAGLPLFGIGAIPGAIIGAGLGALIGFASWQIANAYMGG
ncbi:DUF6861 domain-containing protein [Nocardia elegans]|uniref:DUF6861 domain-containing protein n=1 Tax=Nocardia elegans TaxID=300029 RepID=A0ABW6T907_9NOCA